MQKLVRRAVSLNKGSKGEHASGGRPATRRPGPEEVFSLKDFKRALGTPAEKRELEFGI